MTAIDIDERTRLNKRRGQAWRGKEAVSCRGVGNSGTIALLKLGSAALLERTQVEMTGTVPMVNTDNGWQRARK